MKITTGHIIIVAVFGGMLFSAFIFSRNLNSPELMIVGKWKEVEWFYEKSDLPELKDSANGGAIEAALRSTISENLVIHQSEEWNFRPNSTLTLQKEQQSPVDLHWKLKGRGHILKLMYDDEGILEVYQIKELTENRMVLHFENDIHARGIVKIVFERIEE
jgi:hypothetical protein